MLTEWNLGPEELNNNWTEERIALYLRRRNERIKRWANPEAEPEHKRHVTDMEMFTAMGINVQQEGRA